jgi:predicted ATPase
VRIIATSREGLRVPGEQAFAVLPLALPDRNAGLDNLLRSEAVQLFMERARLQKPGFTLTETDVPAVAEISARLEGIPLALELAAARMRAMSVQDINARLKDRFRLLTGGSRVAMERQQTLRAMVAWSYDMLLDVEQRLLERLSIFAGGFESAAASTVCGNEPLTSDVIRDLLVALVDKSLVMPEQNELGSRYRQLETIREFARERLVQRNELPAVAARHCDHFFANAKVAREKLKGAERAEWTRRVEAELDNIRAAIALALTGGADPFIAVKFEVALMGFRILRGYATEGRKNVRAALALPAVRSSAVAQAWALYVGAGLATSQSDNTEAGQMLEACLALRRGFGNPVEIAATLSTLAQVRLHEGEPEKARVAEEEALGIFREIGDRIGEAICLLHLGEIFLYGSDDEGGRKHLELSLAIAREIAHFEVVSDSERRLGELALQEGERNAARARFEAALGICRETGDKRGEAAATWWLGKADIADGDFNSARARLRAALAAFRDFEMNAEMLACLEDHAAIMRLAGAPGSAVRLQAAIEALRKRLALRRAPRSSAGWTAAIAAARDEMGDDAFDTAWLEGVGWELEDAVRRALAPIQTVHVAR